MQDILIVVDMQNDFIDGALGTAEAVAIVPKVAEKVRDFKGTVIFTRDTHGENYMQTQEGRNLPVPHCIKGSRGWEVCPALEPLRTWLTIDKPTFGSAELGKQLLELGCPRGKELGNLLEELFELCLKDCLENRPQALRQKASQLLEQRKGEKR